MEAQTIYILISSVSTLLIGIVGITGSHFNLKTQIAVLEKALENHVTNHNALEERVEKHESKIDDRLQKMDEKLTEIRDMVMQLKSN
jgi:predicted  nucleic acid-binding Zn-ribbon protein